MGGSGGDAWRGNKRLAKPAADAIMRTVVAAFTAHPPGPEHQPSLTAVHPPCTRGAFMNTILDPSRHARTGVLILLMAGLAGCGALGRDLGGLGTDIGAGAVR